jgi:hypothetical protein
LPNAISSHGLPYDGGSAESRGAILLRKEGGATDYLNLRALLLQDATSPNVT